MKVDCVYVNTHVGDVDLARVCIASVRYWYPQVRIKLIKDISGGVFSTRDLERIWGVEIFECGRKKFGWGYGKLEPLFVSERHQFLVLDADTVLVGPVFDKVLNCEEDFVVDGERVSELPFDKIYYNRDRIKELDSEYEFPGYGFNSGQWFGTSGVLDREDFSVSLDWTEPPVPLYPDIMFNGDQGHLNFHFHRLSRNGGISIALELIMVWPSGTRAEFIDLDAIKRRERTFPFVIHWAGMKDFRRGKLPRFDIFEFYRDVHYSKAGRLQRLTDVIMKMKYDARALIRRIFKVLRTRFTSYQKIF